MRAAGSWRESAGVGEGPLFRCTARTVRRALVKRAADAGVDGRVSGHSLRVETAQSPGQGRGFHGGVDAGGPLAGREDGDQLRGGGACRTRAGGAAVLREGLAGPNRSLSGFRPRDAVVAGFVENGSGYTEAAVGEVKLRHRSIGIAENGYAVALSVDQGKNDDGSIGFVANLHAGSLSVHQGEDLHGAVRFSPDPGSVSNAVDYGNHIHGAVRGAVNLDVLSVSAGCQKRGCEDDEDDEKAVGHSPKRTTPGTRNPNRTARRSSAGRAFRAASQARAAIESRTMNAPATVGQRAVLTARMVNAGAGWPAAKTLHGEPCTVSLAAAAKREGVSVRSAGYARRLLKLAAGDRDATAALAQVKQGSLTIPAAFRLALGPGPGVEGGDEHSRCLRGGGNRGWGSDSMRGPSGPREDVGGDGLDRGMSAGAGRRRGGRASPGAAVAAGLPGASRGSRLGKPPGPVDGPGERQDDVSAAIGLAAVFGPLRRPEGGDVVIVASSFEQARIPLSSSTT